MTDGSVVEPLAGGGSVSHVVMYSGGVSSWAAAKRVASAYGTERLTLLFADTKVEHPDTYRFMRESAVNVGGQLVEIADGRTIWEVFRDERFLGNSRVDPCSRVLKRDLLDRWVADRFTPESVVLYVGLDWTEPHRVERLKDRRAPWRIEAPLTQPPYLLKTDLHQWAAREGLAQQYLYRVGAAHANCGGGCIKMGIGGFARLLAADPATYAEWERNEESLRQQLGDVTILKDRSGGETSTLSLKDLRERVEAGQQVDLFDIGGCDCLGEPLPSEAVA